MLISFTVFLKLLFRIAFVFLFPFEAFFSIVLFLSVKNCFGIFIALNAISKLLQQLKCGAGDVTGALVLLFLSAAVSTVTTVEGPWELGLLVVQMCPEELC